MYKTPNFEILIPTSEQIRTYGRDDVVLGEEDRTPRSTSDVDLYMRIEKVWSEKFREALEEGKNLFAGPQYRLSSYSILDDERVFLSLGATDYREFMGTNVEAGKDPDYRDELMERGERNYDDPEAYFSNTLAICSVIETSDGKIITGLRSDDVAEYPRCWHTVGGHPNPAHYQPTKADLFDAMEREITGELGVDSGEIGNMRMIGLVRNRRTLKPELLFQSEVYAQFDDIKERRLKSEKDEHFTFFGISSPDELIYFLNQNQDEFNFPENHGLSEEEKRNMRPTERPENTTNFFVPSGEASWVLYLRHRGIDVEEELPYLSTIE